MEAVKSFDKVSQTFQMKKPPTYLGRQRLSMKLSVIRDLP